MLYLMIDGPLDGQVINFENAEPAVIQDAKVREGFYVQAPLSPNIKAYRWIVRRDRWSKRHKKVAWRPAGGVTFPTS